MSALLRLKAGSPFLAALPFSSTVKPSPKSAPILVLATGGHGTEVTKLSR